MTQPHLRPAFTLVEILIVVVILGILAAISVPQFARAVSDAASSATYTELQKLRRTVEVFRCRNSGAFPMVASGNGTWGQIVSNTGEYLPVPPVNAWVGGANARVIVVTPNAAPDTAYQTDYAWIFDSVNGAIWAGGFDGTDQAIPRH